MMYNNYGWGGYGSNMGPFVGAHEWLLPLILLAAPIIIVFALWTLFWKGLALWHAAQRGQYWWFVILLVVNTLGILEIIYLFFVSKLKFNDLFTSDAHAEHSHRSHHS